MFKRMLSATLVAMMLLGTMFVHGLAEGYHTTEHIVSLVPDLPANDTLPADSVLPGDTFKMTVKITDQANVGFYAAEIILTYDPKLFSCAKDSDNDGKIIVQKWSEGNTFFPSDWTSPEYEFTAKTITATTPGTFDVKANVIETPEDAFKPGDMAVYGSKTITIVNQFNVTYYDEEGMQITTATQEKINEGDKYEVPEVDPVAYYHLRWTIDDADEYMTSKQVEAESPTADSKVYLHKIANTYAITVDTTETVDIEASYQYDGINDLEGTITSYDPRYDYTVTYSIVDTPFPEGQAPRSLPITGEATMTNVDTFTIDAQYLKGPVQLTITKEKNVEIKVTDFVAGDNNDGWYLVRVYGDAAGYTFEENGTAHAMYSYAGYTEGGKAARVWLTQALDPESATPEGAFEKLGVSKTDAGTIAVVDHDLNQDTIIDFKDATAVHAAYKLAWSDVQGNITRYIQADVTKDGALNRAAEDTNDVLSDTSYVK